MKKIDFNGAALKGNLKVPGDKSISHRAVMLGSLAKGHTRIHNFLQSEDSFRTVEAFRSLGVQIEKEQDVLDIYSDGWGLFQAPTSSLDMGNSGTTARLISGILVALPFETTLIGDDSLCRRPMNRIITPLIQMGANIKSHNNRLPITINGRNLFPINYTLPVDSAQVKSAVLLAGLLTEGKTAVTEKNPTRDHTERMLPMFGGEVNKHDQVLSVHGKQRLQHTSISVPGDISSASFWIAAASITPESHLTIKDVGLNPTRTGFIDVLKRMGANIKTDITRYEGEELVGDIHVKYSHLKPTSIYQHEVASFIDEVPLLALVATQAEGTMKIKHVEELKYKESNRLEATFEMLQALNANVTLLEDGLQIEGKSNLVGNQINTYGDHRIAMVGSIAGFITNQTVTLNDAACINISYPTFFDNLYQIAKQM
ncbi:3-phosphoshikimate 1-carboxyvinyltransferase [Tenuibacillus multivorans]|uniref:3-phosphoshikimate 1-carboxyvinyltransferase n=1 Tax=Tenuibacillus multivorans TaxID=237069 RepID=A0A1H0CUE9_9BACI|nr:3-phosphoshikimate 1-carboxyvinyltransferase [Tenuibacillus multivorans]GEL76159.1 3-phosphoshikimate 1-carboxyvinyltransferase [Tenuibacillus multivorans]SDN61509.1 3-phosphoshikimate 1-carboxyvinyltransferase [Tenuibacillus multivorans]